MFGLFNRKQSVPAPRQAEPAPSPGAPREAFQSLFGAGQVAPAVETGPAMAPPAPLAASANPVQPVSFLDPAHFLVPRDLQVTPWPKAHAIAIGSCLLSDLLAPRGGAASGLTSDAVIFNEGTAFPVSLPQPIETYDFQVIQIPLRAIMRDHTFAHLSDDDLAGHEAAFEQCRQGLKRQLKRQMAWNIQHGLLTFVCNFMTPQFAPVGRLQPRYDLRNIGYFVAMLNQALEVQIRAYRNAYMLDLDGISASLGRRHVQDDTFTAFNHNARLQGGVGAGNRLEPVPVIGRQMDLRPGEAFADACIAELQAMYRILRPAEPVKLVVVDLDDTLWNGLSGEIEDPGTYMTEGWPIGVIEALQYARKRGILLAIASKNDEARIRSIWPKIMRDRLLLEDFAAVRINWNAKADNMREILRTVNLLPRNVLFIDDNPVERGAMAAAFPDMRVLGANPLMLRRVLLLAPEMQVATVTDEARARTRMVQAQLERESDREAAQSPAEFARTLAVRVQVSAIRRDDHPKYARAFELLNKTNQFNTTGQRWTQAEMTAFLAQGGTMVIYDVEDRYTSYGLVGAVLVRDARLVQWVMSCRVIGLGVEHAVTLMEWHL